MAAPRRVKVNCPIHEKAEVRLRRWKLHAASSFHYNAHRSYNDRLLDSWICTESCSIRRSGLPQNILILRILTSI